MNKLEWLSRLVKFDTTSCYSNLQLIDDVQRILEKEGLQTRLTTDDQQQKANLLATIPSNRGNTKQGIVLSGHTDVVPVEGQKWDTDPFHTVLVGNKIFGRGTCDMKGFLAVVLSLVPYFKSLSLSQPIHLAFSYDEEVGCLGAPIMLQDMYQEGIKPIACIVGEPTNMRPVVAHKGIQVFRCKVVGHAAHSSLTPHGCNAIDYAAKLICFIRSFADQLRYDGPYDEGYDVPFTTLSTNRISGGNAYNTIPSECEFIFELRNLPEIKPHYLIDRISHFIQHELQPEMQKEFMAASITLDQLAAVPSFNSRADSIVTQVVADILHDDGRIKLAYATEAGLFEDAYIPTIVCGPGNIEQAHRADEYITLEQLDKCEAFLKQFVERFK